MEVKINGNTTKILECITKNDVLFNDVLEKFNNIKNTNSLIKLFVFEFLHFNICAAFISFVFAVSLFSLKFGIFAQLLMVLVYTLILILKIIPDKKNKYCLNEIKIKLKSKIKRDSLFKILLEYADKDFIENNFKDILNYSVKNDLLNEFKNYCNKNAPFLLESPIYLVNKIKLLDWKERINLIFSENFAIDNNLTNVDLNNIRKEILFAKYSGKVINGRSVLLNQYIREDNYDHLDKKIYDFLDEINYKEEQFYTLKGRLSEKKENNMNNQLLSDQFILSY